MSHGFGPGFDQDELVWGTEAIGQVVNLNAEQARYLLSEGYLPGTKVGRRWVASRTALYKAVGIKTVTAPNSSG